MKKLISLILSICLLAAVIPIETNAEEMSIKYVDVEYGDNRKIVECIYKNDIVFCLAEDLAEMTEYTFYQIDDSNEYGFVREYDNHITEPTLEVQTELSVVVDVENQKADITVMHNNYNVDCYINDDKIYFPMEDFIYLLHGTITSLSDHIYIEAMPYSILDFYASYAVDIAKLASQPEDALINTGWWGSETKTGQAIYSSISEIIKDFDGNLLVLYDPEKGHVKTAQFYEDAILQLSKTDKELMGEFMYSDISEKSETLLDTFNSAVDPILNVGNFCSNINNTIESIPDALGILTDIQKKFPDLIISEQLKKFSDSIENGTSSLYMVDSPEINAKMKELGYVSDAVKLMQIAYNIYDVKHRTATWNSEFEQQLQILAEYENPGWLSDNAVKHINSSSKNLLETKANPTMSQIDEGVDSVSELLLELTFDESPFGKIRSGLEAIQIVYGLVDEKSGDVWDAYTELGDVTYSIKIEQLVREMFRYEDILNTDKPLTVDNIATFRNQLMMCLRLNMRNKSQLYNLNCKANKDNNWSETDAAKTMYDEIININKLIYILEGTKIADERIILKENYNDSMSKIDDAFLLDNDAVVLDDSWKNTYIAYLENLSEDIKNNKKFSLVFVDDNDIPELYYNRGLGSPGGDCLVCYANNQATEKIFMSEGHNLSYIERKAKIRDNPAEMGVVSDYIYNFENGVFTEISNGRSCGTDGPQYDQNHNLVFDYHWNDQRVDEATYERMLNEVYDTSIAKLFYEEEKMYSYSDIIEIIRNFGNKLSKDIEDSYDFLLGEWEVDTDMTMEINGESINWIFGSAFYDYGSSMNFSENEKFSYYVGAGLGGEGSYLTEDDNIIYNILTYEENKKENGTIHIQYDEGNNPRLVMTYSNYNVYWKKTSEEVSYICNLVEDHYNTVLDTDVFSVFESESIKTSTGYDIVLRTTGRLEANVLVGIVEVNTSTGEVKTESLDVDTWYYK